MREPLCFHVSQQNSTTGRTQRPKRKNTPCKHDERTINPDDMKPKVKKHIKMTVKTTDQKRGTPKPTPKNSREERRLDGACCTTGRVMMKRNSSPCFPQATLPAANHGTAITANQQTIEHTPVPLS